MTRKTKDKTPTRYPGTFQFPDGKTVVGELDLCGEETRLVLHSSERLDEKRHNLHISGTSYNGDYLTLVDCHINSSGQSHSKDGKTRFYANYFPHFVVKGHNHIDPNSPCIKRIEFTTTDISSLFYDFDAFGSVFSAEHIIDSILAQARKIRPVATGEYPQVLYFTGKECVIDVATAIGRVSVHHRPTSSLGGPEGVFIKNKIIVSIEVELPENLESVIRKMHDVACYLSILAGRAQGIEHIEIETINVVDEIPERLAIQPSFAWKTNTGDNQRDPHPGDIPLDAIHRPDEFKESLTHWLERHPSWRAARVRYLGCLRKGNSYDVDRLVAAANMFDILPETAVPSSAELSPELTQAKNKCVELLRNLSPSVDRDGALSALGRMGQPSLPKKVAHRAAIVNQKLGSKFPELSFVTGIAIKCRNYFVHGSLGNLDYEKVEPFLPFLTDALEFVFAASDLIEGGWETERWAREPYGWGHSFTRFRASYEYDLQALRDATTVGKNDSR
ncbi:hypothetical protein M8R19_04910 [Pseudomonas sp. R3.Fl]|uniref:ApeA N-terminal domain 1-containing protein n=1 Tax=Pseudomonas sp. R3.Fl TaxID=2928708 RepID=UPI00201DB214|nr:HEPN domain-containing protein [Pseudomonas sp. R3.Fl]MCL6688052.1 hypothetical protein [Pseudomonas sp. R3.Fl]